MYLAGFEKRMNSLEIPPDRCMGSQSSPFAIHIGTWNGGHTERRGEPCLLHITVNTAQMKAVPDSGAEVCGASTRGPTICLHGEQVESCWSLGRRPLAISLLVLRREAPCCYWYKRDYRRLQPQKVHWSKEIFNA